MHLALGCFWTLTYLVFQESINDLWFNLFEMNLFYFYFSVIPTMLLDYYVLEVLRTSNLCKLREKQALCNIAPVHFEIHLKTCLLSF